MNLILHNIRSFAGRHSIPIRPLTVLVGENSSGKSTLLAMLSTISDSSKYPLQPGFNDSPYELGNFDTIATYKGGRYGRAKFFAFGYEDVTRRASSGMEAVYRNRLGSPELSRLSIQTSRVGMQLAIPTDGGRASRAHLQVKIGRRRKRTLTFPVTRSFRESPDIYYALVTGLAESRSGILKENRTLMTIYRAINSVGLSAAVSIAPIRTRPERTYSHMIDVYSPGGEHVPFLLDRLFRDETAVRRRATVIEALEAFGRESGLFKHLRIKQLGKKHGEPFQVMVTVAGREANLIDVGYGVSQALPVIVDSALAQRHSLILIQQPEIHLHPRAQAALGSFFSRLVIEGKHLVIETHSDFIVDRIRSAVALGELKPSMVSLLFLHREGIETTVHALTLDGLGNVTGAPPAYRQFFLEEELDILTRGDRKR